MSVRKEKHAGESGYQRTQVLSFFSTVMCMEGTEPGESNTSSTASYAGMDVDEDHFQATPTSSTSAIVIPAVSGKSIVVNSVFANCDGLDGGYDVMGVGGLGVSGYANNFFVYSLWEGQLWPVNSERVCLPENAALVHYNINGPAGINTYDVIINYTYVDGQKTSLTLVPVEEEAEGDGEPGGLG